MLQNSPILLQPSYSEPKGMKHSRRSGDAQSESCAVRVLCSLVLRALARVVSYCSRVFKAAFDVLQPNSSELDEGRKGVVSPQRLVEDLEAASSAPFLVIAVPL